jgi:two-component system, response regulator
MLIITSLLLPGPSGHELVAEIKRDPALCMLPVIVFTNCRSPWDVQRCYEVGANSYILKPPDLHSLFAAVQAIVVYWLQVITLGTPSKP